MPAMPDQQFTNLNLMAGTARSLSQDLLTDTDRAVWERDFEMVCDNLSRLTDPELGADLRAEKPFYDAAVQVAKGYFNKAPFAGLKAATGQFGFRLISPQDLKTAAAGTTPAYYSWLQTLAIASGVTYQNYAIGATSNTADVFCENTANKMEVLAFHRLISYKPAPRVILVQFNINNYPYAPYNVEAFSKVNKTEKLFKILPMPGRVIIHPGGEFRVNLFFDNLAGASLNNGFNIDIEIAPFGLVFAQYDYLASNQIS